ncbi:MAG TPA: CHAD domain-containing protein [Solirubrobacteraceae bacterium]|nr:CHAD domain-containing protein [Solirubrobacteraceae bacterium]
MTYPTLQLLLPEGLSASAVADALAAELPIVSQKAHTVERTFWDTFDGRLHAAGLTLVAAAGRLALADAATYAEHAGEIHRRPAARLFAGDLPAGALRERLEPLIEMRAVSPIARVRSRQLPLNVLDDIGKIVVRLRVEEPTALGTDCGVELRARLHVIGVLGYDGELERLRTLLSDALGLTETPRPVQHDAVEAVGEIVGGRSSKLRLALEPDERADAAAAKILRRLVEVVELNLPGALADSDSEFLHDLRVAVRRTRALQRELRGVFAPEPLRAFRDGFKELQRITGPTRDLDVQLLEFGELAEGLAPEVAGDVAPLRRLLEDHLHVERRKMVRALGSGPTRALLDNWLDYLERLVASDESLRPDAARAVGDVAGVRIAKVYRRMVKDGSAIDDDTPAEALHELRKLGKELRYLLEFFASLYPAAVVKPMVSSLKGLQDVLGRFQDREVQAALLRSLGDEVALLEGGAAALMAMGVLVQRLAEEQAEARTQFAESFAAFAAKSQRKLVQRTFGCRE